MVEDPVDGWLTWLRDDGAELCPTAAKFTAKVEEHLGGSPAMSAKQSQVIIRARIQRQGGDSPRWMAEVQVLNSVGVVLGSRRISNDSDTCGPVSDALALVSALILSNPPPRTDSREPEPTAPPTAAAPLATSPLRPRGWSAGIEGGPSVSVGVLPGVSLAGEIQLLVAPPAGPALLASFGFWPQTKTSVAAHQGAAISAWIAAIGVCPVNLSWRSRELDLCAGGEVGRMHASGFGFVTTSSSDRWILGLAGGGQLRQWIAGGWFVGLGVRLVVPLLRNRVAYANATGSTQEVFEMWPLAAVGHLRLGYAFR